MRDLVAKIILTLFGLAAFVAARGAEKVVFEANSPLAVAAGEPFRMEFALNAKPDEDSFAAPAFDGFDVLAGPAVSRGSSIQIVNGSMTKSVNYTITYVLLPRAAGNVTVGAAEIAVDGTTYRTEPVLIEVIDEAAGSGAGSGTDDRTRTEPRQPQGDAQARVASDDILLRASVSRSSVYKGEPLRVVFKLYQRVDIVGFESVRFPSFNGFWAQELTSDNPVRSRETLDGKIYETMVAKEYLLYPQQAGKLVIDPAEVTAVARVVVQSPRNMDPFGFGGGHEFYNVPRKLQSQKIEVTVKELPAGAPASFSGAVGRFTLETTPLPDRLAANSAATYTVKISGAGDLTYVQAPKLTLPGSFEQYNVKTTESIHTSAAGATGYRQFEYPFIARADGTYEIDPVEFTYFSPERMQYVTLSSKPLVLEIMPDTESGGEAVVMQGRGMSKEEVRLLGQDIRFIKLGGAQLRRDGRPFFLGRTYFMLLAVVAGVFVAAFVALRKRIRDAQNAALVRGKRANKVAVQRFRTAKRHMEAQNRRAFYEEMLRALWGYVSDKFNIPVANLTKENVREELQKRGVAPEEAQSFTEIITRCDEAQYSPAAEVRMNDVYAEGVELISRIESVIKR